MSSIAGLLRLRFAFEFDRRMVFERVHVYEYDIAVQRNQRAMTGCGASTRCDVHSTMSSMGSSVLMRTCMNTRVSFLAVPCTPYKGNHNPSPNPNPNAANYQ